MLVQISSQPLLRDAVPSNFRCGKALAFFSFLIGLGFAVILANVPYTPQDVVVQQPSITLASHWLHTGFTLVPSSQSLRGLTASSIPLVHEPYGQRTFASPQPQVADVETIRPDERTFASPQVAEIETVRPDELPLVLVPDLTDDSKILLKYRDAASNDVIFRFDKDEKPQIEDEAETALTASTLKPLPEPEPTLTPMSASTPIYGTYGRQRPNWKRLKEAVKASSPSTIRNPPHVATIQAPPHEATEARIALPVPPPTLYDGPYGRPRPNWKRLQRAAQGPQPSTGQVVASVPEASLNQSTESSKQSTESSSLGSALFKTGFQLIKNVGLTVIRGGTKLLTRKPKDRLLALCNEVQPNGIVATPSQRKKIKNLVAKLAPLSPTEKPALDFEKQQGLWRVLYTDSPSQQGKFGPITGKVFQHVDPKVDGGNVISMQQVNSTVQFDTELMARQAVFDENIWSISFAQITTEVAGVVLPRQRFGLYDEVWLWRFLYLDDELRVWRAFKLGDERPDSDEDYLFVTVRA